MSDQTLLMLKKHFEKTNFYYFFERVFDFLNPNEPLVVGNYLKTLAYYAQKVSNGDIRRLLINMPPRYCKSKVFSVALPAFFFGHNPSAKVMTISYSDDLVKELADDCKKVMESKWYKELFPQTRIDPHRSSSVDFATTCNGRKFSTTIHGSITGHGADLIVIDDPLKVSDALNSEREKVNEIYRNTIYSRLNNKQTGRIVVVAQRLHVDDLPGYLMKNADFEAVSMPLIAEKDETWNYYSPSGEIKTYERKKGEPLNPLREGLAEAQEYERNLGTVTYTTQYQQRPMVCGNGIDKESLMKYFGYPNIQRIIFSWDTASKIGPNNSYSACTVLGIDKNKKYYLLDVIRERLDFSNLIQKIMEVYDKYNAYKSKIILIEEASSGIQVLQTLRNNQRFRGVLKGIRPFRSKIDRFSYVSAAISKKELLLPAEWHPWYRDFEEELLNFPSAPHTDQCDALSQALAYANETPSFTCPQNTVLAATARGCYSRDYSSIRHIACTGRMAMEDLALNRFYKRY